MRLQTIGPATASEPTAMMTWYDQLMASGRSETLTTDVGMQQSMYVCMYVCVCVLIKI